MCKNILRNLIANDAGILVMGDLMGIRKDNDLGNHTNQKLHNFWVYNQLLKRLKELGEEYDVVIRTVSAYKTSATCCLCGKQHNGRIHRGLMVCPSVHQAINADVNVR